MRVTQSMLDRNVIFSMTQNFERLSKPLERHCISNSFLFFC